MEKDFDDRKRAQKDLETFMKQEKYLEVGR